MWSREEGFLELSKGVLIIFCSANFILASKLKSLKLLLK